MEINIAVKKMGAGVGNGLFLRARGWGIDHQERKNLQIPGGIPGGMVTGQIEPCIYITA